ncbi:MAG: riboflavin synthase [bacterium]
MFTGIIKSTGKVLKAEKKSGSLYLTIQKPKGWKIKLGESISTDGVCLTVAKMASGTYTCELMEETLKKSYFGSYMPKYVNLEQSMRLGDRLDGHFVLGHVDTVGKIKSIEKMKSGTVYTISYPKAFSMFVVAKGSITVDGISLTVVEKKLNYFSVSLVDYSLKNTTIKEKKSGDPVNLEFDILGKYLLK